MRTLKQALLAAAVTVAAVVGVWGAAWSQSPPPVIVQVPQGGAGASPAASGENGSTYFRISSTTDLKNGEAPITASLGDLLSKADAAGLEKVKVTGRARSVTASGSGVGQIMWTSLAVDDNGEKRTAPLANPLHSTFQARGPVLAAGTKVEVKGDIGALLSSAHSLVRVQSKKVADKDDDAKQQLSKAAQALQSAVGSGGGATNDVAKNYQPLPAPQAQVQEAAVPTPADPTLTVTTDGCQPRVDEQAGFVVIQSQVVADGKPAGTGCTDTADRIPIQKTYASCPDRISGTTAQPQFQEYWVGENGTTNFLGDCQPDPQTTYQITTNTTACPSGPDLASLAWVVQGEEVYTNRNNQQVVVQPCKQVSSTPLQTTKDYGACDPQIDLGKGVVNPEFKSYFINPTTQQPQYYTTCAPDTTAAVAIQKDYAACPDVVGTTDAQRQYQNWYTDPSGKRVNLGGCTVDLDSNMVIQSTSAGCTDYVDQSKGEAFPQKRTFYYNTQGDEVDVAGCAPDLTSPYTIKADYSACPVSINIPGGYVEDVEQLYYMDGTNTRQNVGNCTPDPNSLHIIQKDYTSCTDKVDLADLKAFAQYQLYYTDSAGKNQYVNKLCQPDTAAFPIQADASACHYAVDIAHLTAQEQAELYYMNRLAVRVKVQDCSPDATAPVPVTQTADGCVMRDDLVNHVSIQQKKYVFTDAEGTVEDASPCQDSSETYQMTAVYGVCADLVLSDNSAAFKQIRWQVSPPSGTRYVTDCEPSQSSGDETTVQATTNGCETTFFNYIDQMQSVGAQRFYYEWDGGSPIYVTACLQSSVVYPMQSEIQGYAYNDPQKTAQPKTALYIMPPVGRVDVSPAQVRAGAADIAYTFEKTTVSGLPNQIYYQGCEEYEPTNSVDYYLRPDKTEVSYVTGPGPTSDLGDHCVRTTENQTAFGYQNLSYPAELWDRTGNVGCQGNFTRLAAGAHPECGYPQYQMCSTSETGASITVTVVDFNQQRVATKYPDGSVTYSPWQTISNQTAATYGCSGPAAPNW